MSSAISTDIYTVATHTMPKGRAMWMDVLNTQLTVRSHIQHDRTPLAAVWFIVLLDSAFRVVPALQQMNNRSRSHVQLYSLMQEVSDAVPCLQLWERRTKACCSHRSFFKTKPGFSLRDHLLRSLWSDEQRELAYSPSVLRSDKAAKPSWITMPFIYQTSMGTGTGSGVELWSYAGVYVEIPETLAAAQNNHRFNNMPVFTHGLTCLASKLSDLKGRNMSERNFSEAETDAKTGLRGVRNSTSGGKSLLQSAALVWTTDYELMWKNI